MNIIIIMFFIDLIVFFIIFFDFDMSLGEKIGVPFYFRTALALAVAILIDTDTLHELHFWVLIITMFIIYIVGS